jgi:hypothetical protein
MELASGVLLNYLDKVEWLTFIGDMIKKNSIRSKYEKFILKTSPTLI